MLKQKRLLIGTSIFWLALSMLFDGINTLVLPLQISAIDNQTSQANLLGLLTFFGLIGGALIQPVAGALSDRLQPSLGRKGFIACFGDLAPITTLKRAVTPAGFKVVRVDMKSRQ